MSSSPPEGSRIRPSGPQGLLFEGPEYRYIYVAPLLEEHEDHCPMAIAWRTPLKGTAPGRLVIIKKVVLPPEHERRQRAAEELRLAPWLHHPNITPVLGVEEHQGDPYVVMEHSPGLFLQTAMETALLLGKKLSPRFCVYIAAEVADALDAAWMCEDSEGRPLRVIHRAVSPMSIRLDFGGHVALTDFGVASAQLIERVETSSRVLRAAIAHASPEVMQRRPLDGRADLYSLGLVLLELLAGQYPLDPPDVSLPPGESSDVLDYNARMHTERTAWTSAGALAERIRRFGPEDVERVARDVPGPLKRILHKVLRPHPEERHASGRELRDALRAWLHGEGQGFGPTQAAAELDALVRDRPAPDETRAFPNEKGVLLTPEEAAMVERGRAWSGLS